MFETEKLNNLLRPSAGLSLIQGRQTTIYIYKYHVWLLGARVMSDGVLTTKAYVILAAHSVH